MKTIIILCNLGGPQNMAEIKPFLLDLLGDPNVIRLPFFLKPFQKFLANRIVAKRLPFSQKLYKEIGGKSPLVQITQIQANLLKQKTNLPTFIFMSCGQPNEKELKQQLQNLTFDRAIILPLYPQYSTTTTKTSFERLNQFFKNNFEQTKLTFINNFAQHPKFVSAWTERIEQKLKYLQDPLLLFSAHGIPQSYIDSGDPYYEQVKASVEAIMQNFPNYKYKLSFQSKFGPSKWLEPATDKLIEALEPNSQVLIIPISFVSDHVETIHEIGIELKKIAQSKQIRLERTAGLNASGLFIDCLADLVLQENE